MAAQVATPGKESPSVSSHHEKPVGGFSKDAFLSPDFNPVHLNKIVQESILLGGGIAAILLQVANPGVGAGVNEHSNFTYRVLDRLRTTMTYVYCMSYGTPEEKKTIVDMITRVHSQVSGTLNEGRDKGKKYSALDPELQLWVAATLYATGMDLYERVFDKIEDDDLNEKIYREFSVLAVSLQVPPELWPSTRKDFWEYWERQVATLEVTQHAKDVGKDLMTLKYAPFYLRLLLPSVRLCTAEWLPERIRNEFELKRHPRLYRMHETMVRATYPLLPKRVRTYPIKVYMKDMRKRLRTHQPVFAKA